MFPVKIKAQTIPTYLSFKKEQERKPCTHFTNFPEWKRFSVVNVFPYFRCDDFLFTTCEILLLRVVYFPYVPFIFYLSLDLLVLK